jgi:general stress protein YciG
MSTEILEGVKRRGFASMSPEKKREVSSRGGKMAHASGHAHQFTREEARAAGILGGRATARKRAGK